MGGHGQYVRGFNRSVEARRLCDLCQEGHDLWDQWGCTGIGGGINDDHFAYAQRATSFNVTELCQQPLPASLSIMVPRMPRTIQKTLNSYFGRAMTIHFYNRRVPEFPLSLG